jgi:hypothetical protein
MNGQNESFEFDKPIFLCRNLKVPLEKARLKSKHYN